MSGPKRISVSSPCSRVDVLDDLDRVGRRAAVVGLRLDLGGGVDVHDDDRAADARAFQSRSCSAVIESASEQPASRSGIRTVLSGHRIEAVSAMKCTPQKTIVVGVGAPPPAGRGRASRRRSRRRPGSRAAGSCGRGSRRRARRRQRAHLVLEGGDVLEHQRCVGGAEHREVHGNGLQEEGQIEGGALMRQRAHRDEVYARCSRPPGASRASRRRWPRARRGRPRAPPPRAARPGPCCRAAARGAPAASASSTSSRSRHSTSSGRLGRPLARALRTAAPTPPASAAWFSLIRIAS